MMSLLKALLLVALVTSAVELRYGVDGQVDVVELLCLLRDYHTIRCE